MGNDWGASFVIPYCLIKSHWNNCPCNNNPNKQAKGNNTFFQLRTDLYSPPYRNIYVTGEVRRRCQCSTVGDCSEQVTVGSWWDPQRALLSVSEIFKILDACSNSLFCLGHGFLQYVMKRNKCIHTGVLWVMEKNSYFSSLLHNYILPLILIA